MLNFAQGRPPTNERDTHLVVRPFVRPSCLVGDEQKGGDKAGLSPAVEVGNTAEIIISSSASVLRFSENMHRGDKGKFQANILIPLVADRQSTYFTKLLGNEKSHDSPWVCTLHNSRFSSEEAFERRCFAGGLIQLFWDPRFHGARSRSGCFYWDWGFQEEEEPALCMYS
jgi:hypothetical protein